MIGPPASARIHSAHTATRAKQLSSPEDAGTDMQRLRAACQPASRVKTHDSTARPSPVARRVLPMHARRVLHLDFTRNATTPCKRLRLPITHTETGGGWRAGRPP
ncbi:hypothetical protein PMIN06_011014 [Paraphaeosphaeria minitans]